MGAIFNLYKKYYDNLSESTVGNAIALKESCSEYLNIIKGNFNQVTSTVWEEKGKASVSNIFNQINNNINDLISFINNNLLVVCQKADQVYLKTVEIKECEENLESKQSILSEYEYQLSGLNESLAWEKKKTESNLIDSLQGEIGTMQTLIDRISSEISDIESSLNSLAEEARVLISEILMLDGADYEIVNGSIEDINRYLHQTSGGYVVDCIPYQDYQFPYFADKSLFGNLLITYLANGKTFTTYEQINSKNYNTDFWHGHLKKLGLNFTNDNPLGGGCSGFAFASVLSFFLDKPGLDPGIGFSTGAQWDGIQSAITGEEPIKIFDSSVDGYVEYGVKCDYEFNTYYGRKDEFGISDAEKFKSDIISTFENGGCVILNNSAPGFASKYGQHFVSLMGVDENGYVIISDSMYVGRNASALNSIKYDSNLPYSVDNCPPYLKFNKETGEPFKVDDLVDYLMRPENNKVKRYNKKTKQDEIVNATNGYCCVTNLEIYN